MTPFNEATERSGQDPFPADPVQGKCRNATIARTDRGLPTTGRERDEHSADVVLVTEWRTVFLSSKRTSVEP